MRILHTSDWHLGVCTGPESRLNEQRSFLAWLTQQLHDLQIDVLIIAGDVFDSMHPSAEALELYYRFIAGVGASGVRDVVVVGGNHDSPSRLDAPREVLRSVDVHVVGGVPVADERADTMIKPVRVRGSDEVAAVCLALPYVHEYRLGIRTTDSDSKATRESFRKAFGALYSELVDEAERRYPGVPIVATGHLTLGTGATREDYPLEIHQVGTIEGLPISILDPRICYVALGHIHRSYRVNNTMAWYSGSPVPYSLTEMQTSRNVLLAEVQLNADPVVERIVVPLQRELRHLEGPPETVLAELAALTWSAPLPPLVHVRVLTPMVEPGLTRRLHEVVVGHPEQARPVLVEIQQRSDAPMATPGAVVVPPLEELRPEQVFSLMCDATGIAGASRVDLETAFRSLASADAASLQHMIDTVEDAS